MSFWSVLCRIVDYILALFGIVLCLIVLIQLVRRRFSAKVLTYRVGIAISAAHGLTISIILAGSNTIHLFHFDQYIVVMYSPLVQHYKASRFFFGEFVVFMSFWLAHIIWELVPANCILQYLALCKPHLKTPVRLAIAYGYCSVLLLWSTPYCGYFYQDPLYDNTTRHVHELDKDDKFMAMGGRLFASSQHKNSIAKIATQSILPTYFAAYAVFVWCNSTIHRHLSSFNVKLSAKTAAMQRRFLIMSLMQSLLPLLVMAPPVIMFLFALTGGYALDKGTFLISFSYWAVPIVQSSVALSFIMSAANRAASTERSKKGHTITNVSSVSLKMT